MTPGLPQAVSSAWVGRPMGSEDEVCDAADIAALIGESRAVRSR